MSNYIEPRLRRDFGGVITAYFDFLKGDHKNLFKVFISYNFILIILIFLVNYLSDSGVSGIISLASGDYYGLETDTDDTFYLLYVLSAFLNVAIVLLNAALAGVYLRLYERDRSNNPNTKEVFHYAKKKLGGMFLVVFIGGIAIIPVIIAGFISLIIPFLGFFVFLLVMLSYFTWVGLSMFAYAYDEHLDSMAALGRGWNMLFSKYWKAVGVTFVGAALLYITLILFQALPGILIFIISYNSTMDSIELQENTVVQLLGFLFYVCNSIGGVLIQFLIVLLLGYLYFNLHETKYNQYLKTRIANIGSVNEE